MPLISLLLAGALAPAPQATSAPAGPSAPNQPAASAPAGPQIAFPGQYAAAPAEWKFPVWPRGCARFEAAERTECLEFVAFDYGRLSRYAPANAALAPP